MWLRRGLKVCGAIVFLFGWISTATFLGVFYTAYTNPSPRNPNAPFVLLVSFVLFLIGVGTMVAGIGAWRATRRGLSFAVSWSFFSFLLVPQIIPQVLADNLAGIGLASIVMVVVLVLLILLSTRYLKRLHSTS